MEYQDFTSNPWQHGAFWVFVAIVIFAGLTGRRIIGAVNRLLDARVRGIQASLDEAARLKAEAQAMLEDARAAQAQALEDAKNILELAQAGAARVAASLEADAKAAAKWRERMALERIAAAEASAVNDIRAAAIDIATAASIAILREEFSAEADTAMIDLAIASVPGVLRRRV